MQLTTLMLCDFAQVRENMLFVSSGGVSRVVSSKFPATVRLSLAMVIHVPPDQRDAPLKLSVKLKYPDAAAMIANIDIGVHFNKVRGAFAGEGINIPQAIDLSSVPFPRPGQVDVQVSINEHLAGDLSFWLLEPGGEGSSG